MQNILDFKQKGDSIGEAMRSRKTIFRHVKSSKQPKPPSKNLWTQNEDGGKATMPIIGLMTGKRQALRRPNR